jgi:hypothetical protein
MLVFILFGGGGGRRRALKIEFAGTFKGVVFFFIF